MCAVALPEARFSDEAKRSPIDTSRIPMQRYKLVSTHTYRCNAGIPQVLEEWLSLINEVFTALINDVR